MFYVNINANISTKRNIENVYIYKDKGQTTTKIERLVAHFPTVYNAGIIN